MTQTESTLEDYLNIVSRRRGQLILPALVILLVSTALAFYLPSIYRSEATILVEQQEIPSDLVRSTVTSYAGERIQVISQRVMTTENLGKIIEDYNLFPDQREQNSIVILVDRLRENISLEMVSADVIDPRSGRQTIATIAFKVAFSHVDPKTAQAIANELVSLYLNENVKQRTKSAVETSGFLASEAEKLKKQVTEYEMALAKFKDNNLNNLPELQQLNMQLMERTAGELKDIDQQIRTLEERRIYLESELAQTKPYTDVFTVDGKRIQSPEDRLRTLQAEYRTLLARYAPTHPDVIKLEREVRALESEMGGAGNIGELTVKLESQRAELAELNERYSESHPDVRKLQREISQTEDALARAQDASRNSRKVSRPAGKPDNPAYIQLETQLNAASQEISSLRQVRRDLKKKLEEFESRLMQGPRVEQEYRNLTRDYENALAKYQEINAKKLEAELAQSMELESKGERFSVIEPPRVPEIPVKPNRPAILFVGFVLSFGAGITTVTVAEALSSAIKDPKALMAVAGRPPLVVIPYIEAADDVAKRRAWHGVTFFLIISLAIFSVVAVHYLVMPLDELWLLVQQKLGVAL
jgi:uncharacterized protein involved in exopolysaccharide biosynthesis